MCTPCRLPVILTCAMLLGAPAVTGCSTIDVNLNGLLPYSPKQTVLAEPPEGPAVIIELHPDGGKPQRGWLPLEGVVHAQQALEASGAIRKFGRVKLYLLRFSDEGRGRHRLEIEYDRGQQRIPFESDYALRPNDRFVIVEDTATMFNDMMDSVTRPFGPLFTKAHR